VKRQMLMDERLRKRLEEIEEKSLMSHKQT
jgi:hypothetical protein